MPPPPPFAAEDSDASGAMLTRRFLEGVAEEVFAVVGPMDLRCLDGEGARSADLVEEVVVVVAADAVLIPFSWPATRGIIDLRLFGMRGARFVEVEESEDLLGADGGLARPVASV